MRSFDKIDPSVRLEAQQTPEKHTGFPKYLNYLCPGQALVRFYSSVAVRNRIRASLWRRYWRGPMDRSRQDLPIRKTGSATNARETHRLSKIPKLPVPKAGTCAVFFKRGGAEAVGKDDSSVLAGAKQARADTTARRAVMTDFGLLSCAKRCLSPEF